MATAENISYSTYAQTSAWLVQSAEAVALITSSVVNEEKDRAPKQGHSKKTSPKTYLTQSPTIAKNPSSKSINTQGSVISKVLVEQFSNDVEAFLDGINNASNCLPSLTDQIKTNLKVILEQSGLSTADATMRVATLTSNLAGLSSPQFKQILNDFSSFFQSITSTSSEEETQGILNETLNHATSFIQRMQEPSSTDSRVNLAPVANPSTNSDVPGINKLIAYFTAILFIQVALSGEQAKLGGEASSMTSSLVSICQNLSTKASSDLTKYLAAIEAAKHQSLFQRIFSAVAAVCMFIVGAITGQPALCMMGAFMLIMQLSGGQDAMNNAMSNLPMFGKILCEFAIAGVEAVVTGGITGAMEGGSLALGEEIGAGAAEDVGAGAGQEIEMMDMAGANAPSEAVEESSSLSSKVGKYLTGGVFKGGNLISQLGKSLMMGSFWQDTFTQLAKGCGASGHTAEIVGSVVGIAVGLATACGTSYLEASSNPAFSLKDFMTKQIGDEGFNGIKSSLKGATFAMNVTAGTYGIKQAQTMMGESDIQKDQATTYKSLTVYQGVIDVLNGIFSRLGQIFSAVQSEMGDIMQSGNKFLAPYSPNSYSA